MLAASISRKVWTLLKPRLGTALVTLAWLGVSCFYAGAVLGEPVLAALKISESSWVFSDPFSAKMIAPAILAGAAVFTGQRWRGYSWIQAFTSSLAAFGAPLFATIGGLIVLSQLT